MKMHAANRPPSRVAWSLGASPAGKLVVGMTEKNEICRIAFLRKSAASRIVAKWRNEWPHTEFYRGPKLKTLVGKPIFLVGTAFQRAVWRAIAKIPFGQTRTYGEIARRVGKAGAVRTVGSACGANPVPFLVPCHRVVAAAGLGGFSSGLATKIALLKAEKSLII
jgi:methylated-DNA-[protein]-cysteine S-methyltransferase